MAAGDDDDEEDEEDGEEDLAEARKAAKELEANKAKAGDAWSLLTGLGGTGAAGVIDGRRWVGRAERKRRRRILDALCSGVAKKKKEQAKNKRGGHLVDATYGYFGRLEQIEREQIE